MKNKKNNDAINKGFPILDSECLSSKYRYSLSQEEIEKIKDYIPYENMEPYESQIIDNHGQSLEQLARRGGLTYVELYYAMLGKRVSYKSGMEDSSVKPYVLNILSVDMNGGIDYEIHDNDSFDFFIHSLYNVSKLQTNDKRLLHFCMERLKGDKISSLKVGDIVKMPHIFVTSDCKEHMFRGIHRNIEVGTRTIGSKCCNCCMRNDSEIYEIAVGLNNQCIGFNLCLSCLRILNKKISRVIK